MELCLCSRKTMKRSKVVRSPLTVSFSTTTTYAESVQLLSKYIFVVSSKFIIVVVEQCIQDHHTINRVVVRIFQYNMMTERTVYDPKKFRFSKKQTISSRFFCLRRKPNIPPKPLLEYTRRKHTLKKLRKYIQDGKEERR